MSRTDAILTNEEILQVQQLEQLPNSGANQAIAKENGIIVNKDIAAGGAVDSVFGRTGVVTAQNGDYTKAQVGLGNVDNTSDADKPVSTAQQTEIDTKEDDLGNPTSDGQILSSTTAGVRSWIDAPSGGGSFPTNVYVSSATASGTNNGLFTFTHGISGITSDDVLQGRYKILIAGTWQSAGRLFGDTSGLVTIFGSDTSSPDAPRMTYTFSSSAQPNRPQLNATTLQIRLGSSGSQLTNFRAIVQQMY